MSLFTTMMRRHPPRAPVSVQGVPPPLKIPQHTSTTSSTSYRSAPASEFRDSIGIAAGLSGPNSPTAAHRAFWCSELQYLGIRQLRYTPPMNDGGALQFARDWANTQIDTLGTGKLMIEPGYLTNNWAVERGCTGPFQTGSFRTIDYVMNLFLGDANIRKAINVLELTNEPDNFQCDKYVPPPNPVCDYNWQDTRGLTWLECLGEYCKKVHTKYIMNDPRCAGMQTVAPSPTKMIIDDSEIDANVPNGADVMTQWGDIEPYCQFGTDHPYCGFTLAGRTLIINMSKGVTPIAGAGGWPGMIPGHGAFLDRRQMITEFGHNVQGRPGVGDHWAQLPSFEVLGNYMLRIYLEAFIRGYERFYFFKLDAEGDTPLPRAGQGKPDEYIIYTWNGTGTYASVTNWNVRTECVEMMHRMTTTVGTGATQPNITWSITSPPSDLRWLMLRRDQPSGAHVLFVWRFVNFLAQSGVPLGSHTASNSAGNCSVVTPSPETVHINLPNATTVTETHPIDGAADTDLTISGTGATRGVDVTLREKPFLLVIT